MLTKNTRMYRKVVAMCASCVLPMMEHDFVADELFGATIRTEKRWVFSKILRELRAHAARIYHKPIAQMPKTYTELAAASSFEQMLREYVYADEDLEVNEERTGIWERNFDMHSRLFAIENKVCPRCSKPGFFGPEGGKCSCGFEC